MNFPFITPELMIIFQSELSEARGKKDIDEGEFLDLYDYLRGKSGA